MLKDAHIYRRIVVPFALAVLLLFAFAPAALVTTHAQSPSFHLFGPKQHYLALGDSLAYGLQPNCTTTCTNGYVNDLFQILHDEGTKDPTNYGCPGETSTTFITGGCPFAPAGSVQLAAAVAFLHANAGKVSPVTLDIGADDLLPDFNPLTCTVTEPKFDTDLAALDSNLKGIILPALLGALTVKGRVTGSIVMMNYYDPFDPPLPITCPNSVSVVQTVNQHLADDVSGSGIIVDVFSAFGGATVSNPNLCIYTWICTGPPFGPDIHPTNLGYSVIANTFAAAIPND